MPGGIGERAEHPPAGAFFDFDDVQRALPDMPCAAIRMSVSRPRRGMHTRRSIAARYPARSPIKAIRELPWDLAGSDIVGIEPPTGWRECCRLVRGQRPTLGLKVSPVKDLRGCAASHAASVWLPASLPNRLCSSNRRDPTDTQTRSRQYLRDDGLQHRRSPTVLQR